MKKIEIEADSESNSKNIELNTVKNFSNFPTETIYEYEHQRCCCWVCRDLRAETKSIQRSIALLRKDIPLLIRSELTRLKGSD